MSLGRDENHQITEVVCFGTLKNAKKHYAKAQYLFCSFLYAKNAPCTVPMCVYRAEVFSKAKQNEQKQKKQRDFEIPKWGHENTPIEIIKYTSSQSGSTRV